MIIVTRETICFSFHNKSGVPKMLNYGTMKQKQNEKYQIFKIFIISKEH